jgi:DNA invertase Pin-like site-specific DNA recombinase
LLIAGHKRGILVECQRNQQAAAFYPASVAEFEGQRIADRMREGRTGKRQRGGHIGAQAPYGMVRACVALRRSVALEAEQASPRCAVCTAGKVSLRNIRQIDCQP